MHLDPLMIPITGAVFLVLLSGLALRALGQPGVIGYILAGVALGTHGLGVFTDDAALARLGAVGILLLLFFVGMEVSPRELAARWKIPVIGTLLQVAASLAFVTGLGFIFDWPWPRILLLGFVISLSSTAVVIKLLQDRGESKTRVGQDVIGVLLAQDLAVIGMLLSLNLMVGEEAPGQENHGLEGLIKQGFAGLACLGILAWLVRRDSISLRLIRPLVKNPESQVFTAMLLCFGAALATGLAGLPVALGAFIAGMVINSARETHWVHESLEPFRVVFVAAFFVSVGLLLDLRFLLDNALEVGLLFVGVLLTNTFINAAIFRALGEPWRRSFYAGALLSQVGEFSFVLVAIGLQKKIIGDFTYQATLAVIVLSLIASPAWIYLIRALARPGEEQPITPP